MEPDDAHAGAGPSAGSSRRGFSLSRIVPNALSFPGHDARGQKGGAIWMDNKAVNKCFECNVAFTVFNRKHHCRACGRIFCARCSSQRASVNGVGVQRVCDHCYNEAERQAERSGDAFGGESPDRIPATSPAASPGSAAGVGAGQATIDGVGAGGGTAAGGAQEEEPAAGSISSKLATKYTYFKDPKTTAGEQMPAKPPPSPSSHYTSAAEGGGKSLNVKSGNSHAWEWVLGGSHVQRGDASVASQDEHKERASTGGEWQPDGDEAFSGRGEQGDTEASSARAGWPLSDGPQGMPLPAENSLHGGGIARGEDAEVDEAARQMARAVHRAHLSAHG